MRKTYLRPETWIEELKMESPLLGDNSIFSIEGKSGGETILNYGGGGSGSARVGETTLWDEEEDSGWDQL